MIESNTPTSQFETQNASVPAPLDDHMVEHESEFAPAAPSKLSDLDIPPGVISNLALKLAYTVPKFSTQWAVEKLCLPLSIIAEVLDGLRKDHLLEVLGQAGPLSYHFAITGRGREQAVRLLEISGYVGPVPVSLEDYTTSLQWQFDRAPQPTADQVSAALTDMVLPEEAVQIAGLAIRSRRGLFLYGPPGNGKTSLGYMLHNAVQGDLWIPHCLGIENSIIRVYDAECHQSVTDDTSFFESQKYDRRWVKIRRPFVVVGGELTIEALDLIYSESLGFYEAPLHFKANGGTFLLDDFGCQRVPPQELVNRWIHPLERGVDFLTLRTGQQLEVPFRQMLIVSTNMEPEKVMTPAFLRRMGYRVELDDPTPERYQVIFHRYAEKTQVNVPEGMLDSLLKRYQVERRALHGCEPRDLIERARDICKYRGQPMKLNSEVMDLAWRGYFGNDKQDGQ